MFQVFEGKTADAVWEKIAIEFRAKNGLLKQASRSGPTYEILHAAISVNEPRQRWVIARNPPLSIAFAFAEVIWIMAGRNDSAFLNYFNKDLPKYAGTGPTYHGAYGYRIRKRFNIDQLERAYLALSKNPDSRQIVLQIWEAADDLPDIEGLPLAADIPCNIVSILKVRSGALEWTQIMRSNDIFRGLPYNLIQFTTMQEILAGWLKVNVGSYNHISDSLHVYERDLEEMVAEPSLIPIENTDSLALSKQEFDLALSELERHAQCIIDESICAESLLRSVQASKLPAAYRNICCVLTAEGARKRNRYDITAEAMKLCTNPSYHQLWGRWLSRFAGGK